MAKRKNPTLTVEPVPPLEWDDYWSPMIGLADVGILEWIAEGNAKPPRRKKQGERVSFTLEARRVSEGKRPPR